MPTNDTSLDEVRKLILACLLARPGPTPTTLLDRDYYEMEKERIPWRKFGYANLVEFLKSMPEHFVVEWANGGYQVRGIASEKTKHVSSLVSRQKASISKKYVPPCRRPFINRHMPQMQRPRIRIPADLLSSIVTYVKNNPRGVNVQSVMMMVQQQLPHTTLTIYDIRDQMRELSHFLYLDGDWIFPTNAANDSLREIKNYPQSLTSQPQNMPRPSEVYAGGDEGSDFIEDSSDEDFNHPADHANSNYPRQLKSTEQIAANFANNEQDATIYNCKNDECFAATNGDDNTNATKTDYIDVSSLISDRTKSRLDQLVRQHPEGIWCAELPEKYLKAYNVHLNYIELGFTSVREYVSHLPNIFYMTRLNSTDDFMLYSADKKPTVPDQDSAKPSEIRLNPCEQHDEHNAKRTQFDDNAPIPADVSSSITKIFAPDDVMNYNDSVEHILVTDLQRDRKYLEVYIVEMFHPNFFWVHLRENKKRFEGFMDELDKFYHYNKDKYTIPKIALKKGLHCACIYSGRWHRAIIKSVKPDFRVTVMFYDYGTLKTYPAEDIYYLHKQFSFLRVQAIPCGLYNVKPCVGDSWKKSVIDKLLDRIDETLLALTIMSVDAANNSMIVILSDTSEEEDVHINDWLIKEKLAQCGKMVRMCENYAYLHYLACLDAAQIKSMPIPNLKISDIQSNKVNVDETRHDRNQSVPCSKGAHKLLDVKSENIESKTVEVSRNIPSNKKILLHMLRNSSVNLPIAESSDVTSQPTDCSRNEQPRRYKSLAKLLEKLKTSNISSNFTSSTSAPKPNHDFKDNAQQVDSDMKTIQNNGSMKHNTLNMDFRDSDKDNRNVKNGALAMDFAGNDNGKFKISSLDTDFANEDNRSVTNGVLNMNFALRDSDNEENNKKDFGTFRSLYGGHGLMEPFDWSIIKENGHSTSKTIVTSHNNLDIEEHKSNTTEDESKSHKLNHLEKPASATPYFLNITRKEEEYYLPEKNIDYHFKNVSQSMARLRNRMEVYNDKYTAVVVPGDILETLCNNTQSQNTQSPDTSIIKTNGVTSSKGSDQTEMINGNGETCETRTEQKIEENRDLDANTNNNNIAHKSPESKTTDKVCNSRYKLLLDKIKRMQINSVDSSISSSPYSSKDSSSSEYVASSCSTSTLSSNVGQHEDFKNQSTELCNFKKLASTSSSEFSLNRDINETTNLLSSENSSNTSFTMEDSKQDQSSTINTIVCNVDDAKRSNATVEKKPRVSKILELVLKISETKTSKNELDSDDLSNRETVANDTSYDKEESKSNEISENATSKDELDSDDLSNRETAANCDTSYDKKENKSADNSMIENNVICKSTSNINEKTFDPPVLNDCDLEFDDSNEDWDGDAVDMASIMRYVVVNSSNSLPTYCFAEENLISDSHSKATSTEDLNEMAPTVSEQTPLQSRENLEQYWMRPPPGFAPLGEKTGLPNISARNFHDVYTFGSTSKTSSSDNKDMTTNPFLTDQQFINDNVIPNDVGKQIFTTIWNKNLQLITMLAEFLYDLLERSPLNKKIFENHMIIQHHLNRFLEKFVKTLKPLDNDTSSSASLNLVRETTDKFGSTQNINSPMPNLNAEGFVNQKLAANLSNLLLSNSFGDDRPMQTHPVFPTYGSNNYTFSSSWHQSDKISPRVQVPSSPVPRTPSSVSSTFGSSSAPTPNVFFPNTDQGNAQNFPAMKQAYSMISMNTDVSNNNRNSSSFFSTANSEFANMFKETNPFRCSMTDNMQIPQRPETQSEPMANNYDTNATSYLPMKNLQEHAAKMETVNIHAENSGFTIPKYVNNISSAEGYTPRVIYEAGPVMYNMQKKQTDADVIQNACNNDFKNDRNVSINGQCDKKDLFSPSANDIASSYLKNSSHIDESYITQPPTDCTLQNSPQIRNNESIYHQQNVKTNERIIFSQAWKHVEIPECLIKSQIGSVPSQNHNEKPIINTSINFSSSKDWNCEKNRGESVTQGGMVDLSYVFQRNDTEQHMYNNFLNNLCYIKNQKCIEHNNKNNDFFFDVSFVFQKVDLVKNVSCIFHTENEGWMLTYEFIQTFTNFKLCSRLFAVIEAMNVKVTFKEVKRTEYPLQFLQLDNYPLNVPRDAEKRITSIHLISLQSGLSLLRKLKIVTREEIDNAFKKKEFVNGSILLNMWTLICVYRDLRQRIEEYALKNFR
ncbi:uncharacterized protein LOC114932280 [Nylanderia fulva]|uniref:uncharacterized protein LOC114932280 n=1 Tax=Nylanderia fulva TaxID=613905 RepID=UPI0010FBB598|nr:uncharacterized protein LOC114932280 [Nylanderia fulva]